MVLLSFSLDPQFALCRAALYATFPIECAQVNTPFDASVGGRAYVNAQSAWFSVITPAGSVCLLFIIFFLLLTMEDSPDVSR